VIEEEDNHMEVDVIESVIDKLEDDVTQSVIHVLPKSTQPLLVAVPESKPIMMPYHMLHHLPHLIPQFLHPWLNTIQYQMPWQQSMVSQPPPIHNPFFPPWMMPPHPPPPTPPPPPFPPCNNTKRCNCQYHPISSQMGYCCDIFVQYNTSGGGSRKGRPSHCKICKEKKTHN
jgi:hypothetical protein